MPQYAERNNAREADSTQAGVSDFNVSIGNQPHSECAALAVFLDRFFAGEELAKDFGEAKMRIVPSARGKKSKATGIPDLFFLIFE